MNYGLDIGMEAIRAATDAGDGPTIESVPPVVIPVDDAALEAAGLSGKGATVERDGTMYAVGAAARAVADTGASLDTADADADANANAEPQSLFAAGVLETDATIDTTAALNLLIADVAEGATDGRLCYTTPGSFADAAAPIDARREVVESVLAGRGIDATPISKGFAVVYDQLAADNYTGLGICLEAQTTSAALAYYGVPAMAVTIAKGREWIVEHAAGATGHAPEQVAGVLEDFALDPDAGTGGIESALAAAYDALVAELIDAIRAEADETDLQRGLSVPIAIGGDGVIEGVEFLVGGRFGAAALPFSVRGVRLAENPAESAARGALAAARDGLEGDEGVTGSEFGSDDGEIDGIPNAVETNTGSDGGAESGQTELAFDEFEAGEATADRTDDAIDRLFDRLANRDDEIESVREDLEALFEDLEYVEERTAAADEVEELDERLESFADELTDLEAESETHASDSDVARLDDDIASLDDELEALSDAFVALEDDIDEFDDTLAAVETIVADERADLEAGIDRNGTRVDGVAGRLEELNTRLDGVSGRLEEESERTDARLDAVEATIDEEIAALETTVRDLDETMSAVSERLDDVAEHTASTETVDGLAADLEAATDVIDDDIGSLESTVERVDAESVTDDELTALRDTIATTDDEIASVAADVERLATGLESVEKRVDEVDGDLSDRIDAVQTTLEDDIAALDDDLESVEERIDADDGTSEPVVELEDDVSAIADRLESLRTDHDALVRTVESDPDESAVQALEEVRTIDSEIDSLDERVARVAEQHSGLEERVETIDVRIGDAEPRNGRDEEIEALRTELAAVRDDKTATPTLPSSIVAGGGGAGVVAGGVAVLTGNGVIGAGTALVGLVLIGVAVALVR